MCVWVDSNPDQPAPCNEGCQRCGFPPIRAPAHLLVGPSHHSRLQGAGWPRGRVHHPCTFGVVESGGRPPAFVGTSAPHRTFTDPAPPSPFPLMTATMDLSSPLPGSPAGCGVVEPSGRPPSLSGRGLCGGCPTSTLLYFCIPPTVPPQCDKRHKSETEEE